MVTPLQGHDINPREILKVGTDTAEPFADSLPGYSVDGAYNFVVAADADNWASDQNNRPIDVIAPDQKTTTSILANFKQVVKSGDLRLHPIIGRLVDKETLEQMRAKKGGGEAND